MKNSKTIAMFAIMLVGVGMLGGIASAYRGDLTEQGPNFSEERHELMENAFESGDYDAWYALMTADGRHPRVVDVITEENFHIFAEIHEAREKGDYETVEELREGFGLGQKMQNGDGQYGAGQRMHKGSGTGQGETYQQMRDGSGQRGGFGRGQFRNR